MHDAQHLRGWCQNITAFKGDSVSFPGRPFKEICEVAFLGKEKNENTRDVFYSHGPELPDLPFDSYKGRLEIRTNCSSILKNVQPEDEGWYFLKWDLDQTASVYLRVTDNPQENGHSVTIVVVIIVVCAILLLIGLAIWRGADSTLTGIRGESILFPTPDFNNYCKWWFPKKRTLDANAAAILFSDKTIYPDIVFGEYSGRVGDSYNGSLLIKSLFAEDAGWYRKQCDAKPEIDFYLLNVVDPVCNISVTHICTEYGVQLQCNTTGNENKSFWTHNGERWTESDILPENLTVVHERAHGFFQCNIVCGVLGLQQDGINLTHSACKPESDKSLEIYLGIGFSISILFLIPILIFFYRKRRWLCERIMALNTNHRGRPQPVNNSGEGNELEEGNEEINRDRGRIATVSDEDSSC